ncbi:MAG: alanine--tRNA ligase [Campylobacterales bacterium]|nr:alanine--tRNA ligase [Campylobacterales bacterium]
MDVREAFLKFFESKGHARTPSSPLVPEDASLLFTNAGMVPFKSVFTGEVPVPQNPRAVSCQTCLRAGGKHNDLENVGHTARHHTFFEMLGNFSFGDYFKEEAIAYAWEFVTEVLKLPKEKLWVTVHESDDEAELIWMKYVDKSRIMRLGDKDNFWQMGDMGPCGPCSEIFVDQGAEHFSGPEDYMGGDGDRFLEIWNLVFMQYERSKEGILTPLPKPSIDTGMGLERVTAVLEGQTSNYGSSLFMPIIKEVEKLIGKPYMYESGASYRVIADHIRTVTFLLAQGVNFSNEGRGYVLRRILRRAVRHGYLLGFNEPFMHRIVPVVVAQMGGGYPYLREREAAVRELIELEEKGFYCTIASGIALFNEELAKTQEVFSGEAAFKLYDTFGFPLDLTEDMLREVGKSLDTEGFEVLMKQQRERAKAAWKGSGDAHVEGDFKTLLERFGVNAFVGHESMAAQGKVLALLGEDFGLVDELHARQRGWVLLERTPFYAESGGQCGDVGTIEGFAKVLDTRKFHGLNLSHIETTHTLKTGVTVICKVDAQRAEVAKHHSATHLLHAALYEELGSHVTQAGSLVEADRLRFDFSHPKAMSREEILAVEEWVNYRIEHALSGETREMPIEEAKKSGAKALFGEKYGETVRVVRFGEDSVEFCGGTHVESAAQIGMFVITKESGVSAGVRRIEAVCGKAAYDLFKQQRHLLESVEEAVKNRDLLAGVDRLKEQIKLLKSEVLSAQNAAKEELHVTMVGSVAVVVDMIASGDIKERIDEIKNRHDAVAAMLFMVKDDKVMLAAGAKNCTIKAGDWIKQIAPIVGGGGGGRPDFAQAGGKDASKIDEAKAAALAYVTEQLA